jgi:RNA polymerase sigma factor (sigma-70 family)
MHHACVSDLPDKTSDAVLVARVRAGDRAAFGVLVERHYTRVLALCRRLLGALHLAEDMAQEAMLSALVHLERLREPARFGAWVLAIAANLARSELRRRRTLSLDALDEPTRLTTLWSADPPLPEEVAALRELHDTIVAALAELSPLSREAVIGFYLQGYNYAELAMLLNVPIGALKGRLVYGRRRLRERLSAYRPTQLRTDSARTAPPTPKEPAMSESQLIPMTIDSIRISQPTRHRMVVLHSPERGLYLPIWIGPFEADAILHALEGVALPRPQTHDLTLRLLESLGAMIRQVVISALRENTFFAEIELTAGGATYQVDARPSDALALAARAGASILVDRAVLDQTGVADVPQELLQADTAPPEPLRVIVFSAQPALQAHLTELLGVLIKDLELLPGAADVEGLLAQAQTAEYSIALIDSGDGSDACLEPVRRLRAKIAQLPMLVLGPADAEAEQRARAAAGNARVAYLAQPIDPAALQQALVAAL